MEFAGRWGKQVFLAERGEENSQISGAGASGDRPDGTLGVCGSRKTGAADTPGGVPLRGDSIDGGEFGGMRILRLRCAPLRMTERYR